MSPEHTKCPQCGTKFPYSKRSQTLAGKLESLFERVGRVVVIGGAALVLILFLAGGVYLYRHFGGASQTADQAAHVETIVNTSFDASSDQPASFQIVVPSGASNARVVGGYKVTSGPTVNFYILDTAQHQQAAKENLGSARLRQPLSPGTYVLRFVPTAGATGPVKVAAEFYLKYD
jgi:hypothetical protein